MNEAEALENGSVESLLSRLTDEFLERLDRGEQPVIEEYAGRYPELAAVLRHVLPALQVLRAPASVPATSSASPDPEPPMLGCLGDYRLLREAGRGGMGVVYEAVQISLGRQVALKVLPFASALDAKQLQRFKNEAQAAACLHHTNIVPVFAVGCERGLHYYAMQFIDGQTLAALIDELRGSQRGVRAGESTTVEGAGVQVATAPPAPSPAGLSSRSSFFKLRSSERFRTAASLGVQAAVALEHAHGLGVIHRDIKPANLMLDARGNLWITDFGLAHCQSQAGLTMTGDLVGTLRYMSPEQALAQRVTIDHRTDIYSLGVTLYELLTLEPVLNGRDRQELLRQIAFEEPRLPRRINKAIPAELETIVLKAIAKNPAERYATARELADDLERFLKDEPIRARRPTLAQRARKWSRRHRPVMWAGAVCLVVAAVLSAASVGWVARDKATQQAAIKVREDEVLERARGLIEQGNWPAALALARRAEALLESGGGDPELQRRVRQLLADLRMVAQLEDIRLQRSDVNAQADANYTRAFREYGINVSALDPQEAAAQIRAHSIRDELAVALEDWAGICRRSRDAKDVTWRHLLNVARATDPDPRRNQVRDAWERMDNKALEQLAASAGVATMPPATLVLLARAIGGGGSLEKAVGLLRRARQQHPGDFWINEALAFYLKKMGQPHQEEAIRYYAAAVSLRPKCVFARLGLAQALSLHGALDEAVAGLRQAIPLDPSHAHESHNAIGAILANQNKLAEAVVEFRQAIKLDSKHFLYHYHLGIALMKQEKLAEAIAEYRLAIKFDPTFANAHNNLGFLLYRQNKLAEAIAEYRLAIKFDPKHARAYKNLGNALGDQNKLDEAITEYRLAIKFGPKDAQTHYNLGNFLKRRDKLDEAIIEYRLAIEIDPKHALAHNNLGSALFAQNKWDEAIAEFRLAIEFDRKDAKPHFGLGNALFAQGNPDKLDEAIAAFRHALKLDENYAKAHCMLGAALAKQDRLDDAIAAFRKAIQVNSKYARAYYGLGCVLSKQNKWDDAIKAYGMAIQVKPGYAEAHCTLGGVLRKQGHFAEALEATRRGHDLGSRKQGWSHPSAQWVRECEQLVELDKKLTEVLRGAAKVGAASEQIDFAFICQRQARQLYGTSVRFYEEVFRTQPEFETDPRHRYNAACAAALAGAGQGKDQLAPDEQARARYRKQALDWLRADLVYWGKQLENPTTEVRAATRQTLEQWKRHPYLASLRDAKPLAKLSEIEREGCRQLWLEVETLLQQARNNDQP